MNNISPLLKNRSEKAVSPVVGVILMVAITVVLSAIIGGFVLGLGDTDTTATAGVEIDTDNQTVNVVTMGNADELKVLVNGDVDTTITDVGTHSIETELEDGDDITVISVIDGNETYLTNATLTQQEDSETTECDGEDVIMCGYVTDDGTTVEDGTQVEFWNEMDTFIGGTTTDSDGHYEMTEDDFGSNPQEDYNYTAQINDPDGNKMGESDFTYTGPGQYDFDTTDND